MLCTKPSTSGTPEASTSMACAPAALASTGDRRSARHRCHHWCGERRATRRSQRTLPGPDEVVRAGRVRNLQEHLVQLLHGRLLRRVRRLLQHTTRFVKSGDRKTHTGIASPAGDHQRPCRTHTSACPTLTSAHVVPSISDWRARSARIFDEKPLGSKKSFSLIVTGARFTSSLQGRGP